VPFGEEAEYSRKLLVARGILRARRGANGPVGESHLSIAWTVPAYWKLGLYFPMIERVGAEEIELFRQVLRTSSRPKGGARVKVASRMLLGDVHEIAGRALTTKEEVLLNTC